MSDENVSAFEIIPYDIFRHLILKQLSSTDLIKICLSNKTISEYCKSNNYAIYGDLIFRDFGIIANKIESHLSYEKIYKIMIAYPKSIDNITRDSNKHKEAIVSYWLLCLPRFNELLKYHYPENEMADWVNYKKFSKDMINKITKYFTNSLYDALENEDREIYIDLSAQLSVSLVSKLFILNNDTVDDIGIELDLTIV
jgi:hypothetical protein